MDVPEVGDFGAAFGAARLGLMAATGAGAELATAPAISHTILPDTKLVQAFGEGHARFRAAYPAIQEF